MGTSGSAPRTEPAIDAVLVAHGSPSEPEPQEAALARLAAAVGTAWQCGTAVRSATLAMPGALEEALAGLRAPVIYPVFMTDGWFVRSALPSALKAAGHGNAPVLDPVGRDPALHALCAAAALACCELRGWAPGATMIVLAAHGSARGPRPAIATQEAADGIAASGGFRAVVPAYVEESPYLAESLAAAQEQSLCLPFFALQAGHVEDDLPAAVAEAGFAGPVLPHIGAHPGLPSIIASALRRSAAARASA